MSVFGIDPDKRVDVPNGLRRTGVTGGKGIFDQYMNQILFELKTNHIWGTETQVKLAPPEATFYTDGSGNPLDKNDAAVTINEDDKILIIHDVAATAAILLDCGGSKVRIEMAKGVNMDMSTFDLDLGVTAGDLFSGDIELTGTGTLTVKGSNGLRIHHTAMTIVVTEGDSVINNINPFWPIIIWRMINNESLGSQSPLGGGGADWEISDDLGPEFPLGASSVTESSGVFSFATTGYWSVRVYARINSDDAAMPVHGAFNIKLGVLPTGWPSVIALVESTGTIPAISGWNAVITAEILLKITDVAKELLEVGQLDPQGEDNIFFSGDSGFNHTYIVFEKKADLD